MTPKERLKEFDKKIRDCMDNDYPEGYREYALKKIGYQQALKDVGNENAIITRALELMLVDSCGCEGATCFMCRETRQDYIEQARKEIEYGNEN